MNSALLRILLLVTIGACSISDMAARPPLSESLAMLAGSSDLIVVATVCERPMFAVGSRPVPSAVPVVYFDAGIGRISIEQVLKGIPPPGRPLVEMRSPRVADAAQADEDVEAMMDKFTPTAGWIFFLKDRRRDAELGTATFGNEPVYYIAFDPWLSIQPYHRWMALEVQTLVESGKK